MVLGIILLFVAILSVFAVFREMKHRNIFAILFSGASALVFGWFSVMTILNALFPDTF
ncbi:DUF2759 domain-containing protein [Halalkalibacillus sediminis]|uniref:DUF2759 domain-containing protein n=1 Tax=Halalkalibacillus sediminis TaxID=2018042 RepID=A0A2I0QXF5_9BACI|nr:DUF2759 domain-containing protein [Halalkalibacillus sediminis]PKR78988.1 DUF2759 domain-containing protein [Halalkalibacillus sediminis]